MIGVFDSGIGGLTVLRALMRELPGYDLLYFGDTARTPYGNKSARTVQRFAQEDTSFLMANGAKLVVVACHSASSLALDRLSETFAVPLFEVISPAVAQAVTKTRKGQVGVIGTRATVESGIYPKQIHRLDPSIRVFSRACPLLVPLVEEGWSKKPETTMIVKKYLLPLKTRQIDTLILGCTHYPVLASVIQKKIGKRVYVIDSADAVARSVRDHLADHPELDRGLSRHGRLRICASDVTPAFETTARQLLGRPVTLEAVTL